MLPARGFASCLAIGLWSASCPVLAQEDPVTVETVSVERREIITEVAVSGSVLAPRASWLSASTAGLVLEIGVDAGDRVQRDDVLVRLDDTLVRLDVRTAEAEREAGRARLLESERLRDEAEAVGARANIPETELRAREHAVRLARAELSRHEAVLARQRERLERHRVKTPYDGVITARAAEPGEWVTPGDTLLELVDVDQVELEFQVPQEVFHRVTTDAALTVQLDAGDDTRRDARILRIVPVTDPQARTFSVRARMDDGPRPVSGMSVSGLLRLASGDRGLVVPRQALNRYPEGRVTVWVIVEEDGETRVRERRVTTGERFADQISVREGLSDEDEVVVTGNAGLQDGQDVTVQ